jgi:cytidylate kinase
MRKQILITIEGAQGAGKTEVFKMLSRSFAKKLAPFESIFGFDGEGRRMSAEDRKKKAKADIVILTKQTYKKRRVKKKKD